MVLNYLPDGDNTYDSKSEELKGSRSNYEAESCKTVMLGGTTYSLVQTLLLYDVIDVSFSHIAQH